MTNINSRDYFFLKNPHPWSNLKYFYGEHLMYIHGTLLYYIAYFLEIINLFK